MGLHSLKLKTIGFCDKPAGGSGSNFLIYRAPAKSRPSTSATCPIKAWLLSKPSSRRALMATHSMSMLCAGRTKPVGQQLKEARGHLLSGTRCVSCERNALPEFHSLAPTPFLRLLAKDDNGTPLSLAPNHRLNYVWKRETTEYKLYDYTALRTNWTLLRLRCATPCLQGAPQCR